MTASAVQASSGNIHIVFNSTNSSLNIGKIWKYFSQIQIS